MTQKEIEEKIAKGEKTARILGYVILGIIALSILVIIGLVNAAHAAGGGYAGLAAFAYIVLTMIIGVPLISGLGIAYAYFKLRNNSLEKQLAALESST